MYHGVGLGTSGLVTGVAILKRNHFHLGASMEQRHAQALKDAGMKATPKRLAILGMLYEESAYASPEELWKRLRDRFDRLGLPTVYRNLEELAASGVISRASSVLCTSFTRGDIRESTLPFLTPGRRSIASVTRLTLARIFGV